ncbi:alginate lyase family protein [Neptunicella marina]|uniref:Alginate lyase family protein n=1 Tax=Neptunicella marina TaxID=2125989 RepID=A0A8J6IW25_9ALTE|nr:alginate lyase family protein [Neptunicella marina]
MSSCHNSLRTEDLPATDWLGANVAANQERFNSDVVVQAVAQLQQQAEKILRKPVLTVVSKKQLPASGNAHDYFSVGPYWWPNPETVNGLPWVRRDGQVNPAFRRNDSDNMRMGQMVTRIHTLMLANYYKPDRRKIAKAAELLRVWFIAPETRMTPHMDFAQSIPGRTTGRGIGIIDARVLVYLLDVMPQLQTSLTSEEFSTFKTWLKDFYHWLQTSNNGIKERMMHNNHGNFYDLISASIAFYLKDQAGLQQIFTRSLQRVEQQILVDGSQPHELIRTRPFHYSAFNLHALFGIARFAELSGVDLWQRKNPDAPLLRAYTLLLNSYTDNQRWKGSEEANIPFHALVPLALQVKRVYQRDDFFLKIKTLPAVERQRTQSLLGRCALIFDVTAITTVSEIESFCNY